MTTGEDKNTCASVPCPSFGPVTINVFEVCNCGQRWGHWGNPWGDPDCPVHGERVRQQIQAVTNEAVAQAMQQHKRDAAPGQLR